MSGKPLSDQTPRVEGNVANTPAMLHILNMASTPELYRMLHKGLAVKSGKFAWDWVETVRNMMKFYRAIAAGHADEEGNSAMKANIGLRAAQERLTQIRADQLSGKLVPIDDVEAAWAEAAINVRQLVLSIPGRIQFGLPHITAQDRATMESVCRDALEEAASGAPPKMTND